MHSAAKLPNADGWHGACLSLTIEGNWSSYRAKLLKYLRQIAVITPYAQVWQCSVVEFSNICCPWGVPQLLKYLRQIIVITPYAQVRRRGCYHLGVLRVMT